MALVHDVVITVGIYALVGFEVTPATVIGVLTILGYSLYDTVVVFDKVKENTRGLTGGSRMTYSDAANLAVNQTLVRSINTSVVGLLPVAALLFVGAYVLGAGTLKDLALALFVGIAVGTYSSIFVATPFLAELKEREPAMQALSKRVGGSSGQPGRAPRSQRRLLPRGRAPRPVARLRSRECRRPHRRRGRAGRATSPSAPSRRGSVAPSADVAVDRSRLDWTDEQSAERGRMTDEASVAAPRSAPTASRRGCGRRWRGWAASGTTPAGAGAAVPDDPVDPPEGRPQAGRSARTASPRSGTRASCAAAGSPTSPIRWRSRRSWPSSG